MCKSKKAPKTLSLRCSFINQLRMTGLEPVHSHLRQILSLMRLPFRHSCVLWTSWTKSLKQEISYHTQRQIARKFFASGKLFYTYFKKKKHIVKNDDFQAFLLTKVIIYDNLLTCEKRIAAIKTMNEWAQNRLLQIRKSECRRASVWLREKKNILQVNSLPLGMKWSSS